MKLSNALRRKKMNMGAKYLYPRGRNSTTSWKQVSDVHLRTCPPNLCDRWQATHYPRDETREGRHIDAVLCRLISYSSVTVNDDVRFHVNTDHVCMEFDVQGQRTHGGKWRDTRPHWVVTDEALPEPGNWDDVKTVAKISLHPRDELNIVILLKFCLPFNTPKQHMVHPITVLEVGETLAKMRARSSVGHDGVSVDLLRRIFEEHPNCLCELLTAVLATGCFPADWGDSLLALLPKTLWPTTARELRPIALSSAGMKLMSKIIITRAFSYLRDPSPWSACGCGRSTADLHGCMGRQRDLCGEWRLGIMVAKLDVEAAFDNDSRAAIADFLNKRLADTDAPHESRFLLLLLQENVLYGTAPGGRRVVTFDGINVEIQPTGCSVRVLGLDYDFDVKVGIMPVTLERDGSDFGESGLTIWMFHGELFYQTFHDAGDEKTDETENSYGTMDEGGICAWLEEATGPDHPLSLAQTFLSLESSDCAFLLSSHEAASDDLERMSRDLQDKMQHLEVKLKEQHDEQMDKRQLQEGKLQKQHEEQKDLLSLALGDVRSSDVSEARMNSMDDKIDQLLKIVASKVPA
ncbi:unnamed protein product [Symbiodinium microadriaticum]|nr:unnamed protein product [Symbiodinium microadriaticum]